MLINKKLAFVQGFLPPWIHQSSYIHKDGHSYFIIVGLYINFTSLFHIACRRDAENTDLDEKGDSFFFLLWRRSEEFVYMIERIEPEWRAWNILQV